TWLHDAARGGYFYTAHDAETLIVRPKSGADGSIPSGSSVAALVLLRLHAITGEESLRSRAEDVLRLYQGAAAENPFGYTTWLEALERWAEGATEVVVVGASDSPDTRALWRAVAARWIPHRTLVHLDPAARRGAPRAPPAGAARPSPPVRPPSPSPPPSPPPGGPGAPLGWSPRPAARPPARGEASPRGTAAPAARAGPPGPPGGPRWTA